MDGETLVKEYLATRNPETRERAVRAYLSLVRHIVNRMRIVNNGVLRREDAYQFGIVGLLSALERYNPEYGVIFKTYAYKRIYGEIVDAFRREGLLNKDQMRDLKRIAAVEERLRGELGRDPQPGEICAAAGITEERYNQIQELIAMSRPLSLDETFVVNNDDALSRRDVIADRDQGSPDRDLEQASLKKELKRIIQDLPERARLILALYYYEDLTLADIGQVLELSESRVSQILNQTIAWIRKKIQL
jgi:RNA polymerase sigma factor for flagellar operon FliA